MMPLAQSLKRIKKNKTMGYIKTFVLGIATAYGIYYLTKKRPDGTSLLDDIKDNPSLFLNIAKNFAEDEAVDILKRTIARKVLF